MGARIIREFLNDWAGQVSNRDAMGFMPMCLSAKDDDIPRTYWGGLEPIANAVGADWQGNPASAKRTAMKIIKSLTDAGLIVSSGQARMGVRAEYAITLDPKLTYRPIGSGRAVKWEPVPRADPRVNETDTLQGERNGHPDLPESFTLPTNETFTLPTNETFTPRNHRGTTKEYSEDNSSFPASSYLGDTIASLDEGERGVATTDTLSKTQTNDDEPSIEDQYAAARDTLQYLHDAGQQYLTAIETTHPDLTLTQRVIKAAELAQTARKDTAA
ncbi:hypothetical protein GCM10027417_30540 [Glutamicibacter endophyticus]